MNPNDEAVTAGAAPAPAVTLRRCSFRYPTGLLAVKDVSLELRLGHTLGLVGPSGCGKSTLLSLIAGFATPTQGEVVRNLRATEAQRHPLAMVFQKNTLLPWLTVRENVGLYYRFNKHADLSNRGQRVDELLALTGLADFGDAYPYQLSGGMQRRVALAAAIVPAPQVLLMDEPFSSVDEPTRVMIHDDVRRILRGERKMATVLVTHDLAEALSLCDVVVVMTRRPGTLASRHEVDFGAVTSVMELRSRPEFFEQYGVVWENLASQIEASSSHPLDNPDSTESL